MWVGRLFVCAVAVPFALCSAVAAAFDLQYVGGSKQVFAEPHDIVLSPDGQRLYVADNSNDRIAVLDPETLDVLGTFAEGEVGAPHDVAFDAAGRLLVADTDNSRIAIYEVSGASARPAGELRGVFRRPEGVAVNRNGRVYVTGATSGNIEAFEDGNSVAVAGGFSSPHDVAVAADGTVWVADSNNDRLVAMSPDLETKTVISGAPYDFDGPRYLDFDAADRLYVADKNNHRIKVLAADRALLFTLGADRAGLGPGLFDRPEGVAVRGTAVWFSDTYNDRIVRYRVVE
jgi:YVTN family beta-propeller protein